MKIADRKNKKPPMLKRSSADAYVQLIQARAVEVNRGPYAFRVERIEVFGSYLTDKPVLGDLDILVTLRKRYSEEAQQEAIEENRRRAAYQAGRTFGLFIERMFWPEEEVHRAIRQRNYRISLHRSDEKPQLTGSFETIFEE